MVERLAEVEEKCEAQQVQIKECIEEIDRVSGLDVRFVMTHDGTRQGDRPVMKLTQRNRSTKSNSMIRNLTTPVMDMSNCFASQF